MYFVCDTEADIDDIIAITGGRIKFDTITSKWVTEWKDVDTTSFPTHAVEDENIGWYTYGTKEFTVLHNKLASEMADKMDRILDAYHTVKKQFTLENIMMGITTAGQTSAVLAAFKDVDYAMENYSIYAGFAMMDDMDEISPFITEARLNDFKTTMLELIG